MQTLSTSKAGNIWLSPHPKLDGMAMIDHLFNRLDGLYPSKFRASFRDMESIGNWREAWAEAFDEDGITPNDIAVGIKNCRRMFDWPPSLPEFLRACRPGLDPESAFHEAVHGLVARRKGETGTWTHPAIYHAAIATGQHDILNCTYSTLKTRWGKALSDELAKGQWAEIPQAAVALPEPRKTELTNKQAQAAMEKMGAGNVLDQTGRDHKAWIKKILDNPKRYGYAAIQMAERAMSENA